MTNPSFPKHPGSKFKLAGAAVTLAILTAATWGLLSNDGTVSAFIGVTTPCDSIFCHFYQAATLRISTDQTSVSVVPGASFQIGISWTGGNGLTEINWPYVLDNVIFSPTPRVPADSQSSSGSTSSTLTAPVTPGVYTVRVYASKDNPRETDYREVSITILSVTTLQVATSSLPATTAGSAYTRTLTAAGGTSPYTWALGAGALPSGLTLNPSGVISGTPVAAGTFNFSVRVTDSVQATATAALSLTVNSSANPLRITTASLAQATAGSAYNQTLSATGGGLPYSWSLVLGNLPSGLTLSPLGAISGTPVAPGTFNFSVRVTDGLSTTATAALSILVNPAPVPLRVITASLPDVTTGTAYNQTLSAAGGSAPYTWSLASGALPAGLSLNSSGVISGTPGVTGTFNFVARVVDAFGANTTIPLSLNVNPQAPITTSQALTTTTTINPTATTLPAVTPTLPPGVTLPVPPLPPSAPASTPAENPAPPTTTAGPPIVPQVPTDTPDWIYYVMMSGAALAGLILALAVIARLTRPKKR